MTQDEDKTGQRVSLPDIDDAIGAMKAMIVRIDLLTKIPPQVAVNLPNILRCLQELRQFREQAKT